MPQGIGDIIMTIPVLEKIARSYPVNFSITLKSKSEASVIKELCPDLKIEYVYLQEIIDKVGLFLSIFVLILRLRALSPDIILTQYNVSSFKSSLISFFAGIKKRVGWKGPLSFLNTLTLSPSAEHKIAENMKSLKILNLYSPQATITYPKYNRIFNVSINGLIDNILKSKTIKIAISPGSQELDKHKRWPESHYITLIEELKTKYVNTAIFLVGNTRERQLCEDIIRELDNKDGVFNLAGETTIRELLYLLSKVDLTVTHCNGIAHLACAASSPIIGLYGPTDYKITGPISPSFIPVNAELDCAPCFARDYQTGCGDPICMEKISVLTVFNKSQSILNKL